MFHNASVKLARYEIFVFLSAKYAQCYSIVLWLLLSLMKFQYVKIICKFVFKLQLIYIISPC